MSTTTRYYYAHTDEMGVLCVERCGDLPATLEEVARIADHYPDTIYFEVTR